MSKIELDEVLASVIRMKHEIAGVGRVGVEEIQLIDNVIAEIEEISNPKKDDEIEIKISNKMLEVGSWEYQTLQENDPDFSYPSGFDGWYSEVFLVSDEWESYVREFTIMKLNYREGFSID